MLTLVPDACSHERCTDLWAESVKSKNANKFLARQCGSYETYLSGGCDTAPSNNLGIFINKAVTGNFYLRTLSSAPYSVSN
jgi:Lipase